MELETGDVVYLKSGSPKMTIGIIKDGIAECAYFVRWGKGWDFNRIESIPLACLKKV